MAEMERDQTVPGSGAVWPDPHSIRNTQNRVPRSTSRWLLKFSKEETPQPLCTLCQYSGTCVEVLQGISYAPVSVHFSYPGIGHHWKESGFISLHPTFPSGIYWWDPPEPLFLQARRRQKLQCSCSDASVYTTIQANHAWAQTHGEQQESDNAMDPCLVGTSWDGKMFAMFYLN